MAGESRGQSEQSSMVRGAQRGLLRRLRTGLGLGGLAAATIGSGPCGSCPEPTIECPSLEELEQARAEYLTESGGRCLMGAAGQAGDAGQPCADQRTRLVEGWSPEKGCPDVAVIQALESELGFVGNAQQAVPSAASGCCYEFTRMCGEGRPFLVCGEARVASLHGRNSHHVDEYALALCDDWARDALAEHASVAAFARLTLYLMAAGAPAALIEKSQRASLDELGHAEFCFAQASKHAGESVAPGKLDLSHALEAISFEELMWVNLIEGCIGESLAAVRVSEQARLAEEPELARALRQVSEDEAGHALLAFEILAWGLQADPAGTRPALERALRGGAPLAAVSPADWTPSRATRWNRAGRLTPTNKLELDRSTWRVTVRPVLLELLQAAAPAPQRGHHDTRSV